MRFSVEQIFLTDCAGKALSERGPTEYHVVEADTLDAALTAFLLKHRAGVIGTIQRFHGAQAVATVHQEQTVFTVHFMLGSDGFRQEPRRTRMGHTGAYEQSGNETRTEK